MVAAPVAAAGPVPAAGMDVSQLKLGVASYSLREFGRSLAIKMIKRCGVGYVSIKEFHLPYRATAEDRAKGRAAFEGAGLKITGGGTIYMMKDDPDDIKFYFEYAKQCGMPLIVAGASPATLPLIEKAAQQYDIKVAVHNHGPEDKFFPVPQDILKVIRNMDPRIGVCADVGHTTRMGMGILEALEACGPRLLDLHIKDLKDLKDGKTQVPVGEGSMPIPQIFKLLAKMNYQGAVMLEYEIDGDAPLEGMLRSFSYMRGVIAGMRA